MTTTIIERDADNTHSKFSADTSHECMHNHTPAHEEAEAILKQHAISFITTHLDKSLKQAIELTKGNSDEFIGFPATCFAPDTDPSVVEDFYKSRAALENSLGLPDSHDSRFNLLNRWTTTASDGGGLGQGDFTTLTWSYVPDGTPIGNSGCQVPGESSDPSDFIAFFNGIYGGPTTPGDFTTAPWHAVFVSMFDSWSAVSGLNFVYEPNDDGATVVTGGAGAIGVRGDLRISGHRVDGNSNVLACNYFPQNGDMIIDTDDNYYSNNPGIGTTNVLTHEIGHGLGILHVCPVSQTKLMEPFVTTVFTGPQEDDILATNRNYGDPEGANDTSGTATVLGSTANPVTYNRNQRSVDDNGDVDYYSFTISQSTLLSGTLTPTGTLYLSGVQNGDGSCSAGTAFNALTVADVMFEILNTDGVSVLATGDANGPGVAESVTNISLPSAGTYFVRVSQQGASVDNVQMYDLSISLTAAVLTPEIAFASTTGNGAEGNDCSFTDVNVNLNIGAAPSANAEVSFSIDGSSTASQGSDFDLMTSSVIFNTGSTASQTMTLRIYHDAFVEGDETIVVNTSLNANGGDATLNPAADTFTYTITNDDVAPVASFDTNVFSADFEDITGWTVADNDGDGNQWLIFDPFAHGNLTGRWAGSVTNLAVIGGSGILTPDNFLFSPAFSIPADATNTEITFEIGDLGIPEHYAVYFASTNSVAAALSGTLIEEANTIGNDTDTRTVNLASLAGQTGHLAFRHYNTTGNSLLMLDTIDVVVTQGTPVQTAVNSGTPDQVNINGTGTAHTADPGSGDVMLDITNSNSFDYGCADVSVSRAGTGAQSYNGSTAPNLVTDKTFTITPTNTTGSGNTSITFYFTEAEIAGWEAATGLLRGSLVAARGSTSSVTETSALTIGSFGSNVTLTGTFTGLNGNYYFGTASAFTSCAGVTKTWDGANWSPAGPPDATNEVILAGNYNTNTHGNLNACKLTINTGFTLIVPGSTYTSVAGDITVDGTVVVEHEGSVVQTDANPIVQNNGTINVNLTTPNLASRDFMVMGSPMTAETRESVWNTAFLVLDAETVNFVPHPDVEAMFPGAENFADDNNDFWSPVVAGTIEPGVGYIVRPQAGYGQPGGVFNYMYDGGTLNTGTVNFTVVQNTPGPTPADNKNASPNIMANPYASAIFADDFINANSMIDELYFWEHLTPPSSSLPGAGSMNFSMEDISMYNLSGGTAAASDGTGIDTRPNGYVSTGQGFGIKATVAGTAVFTNAMRRTDNNNTLRVQEDRERIWLNLSTSEYGMQKQALLAFNGDNASEGMDPGYDSRRLATVVSLYTHLPDGTEELGIQTLGQFDHSITVPVGFSTLIDADTEYKISIADIEGPQLMDSEVYIIDHQTGVAQNLRADSYGFVSGMGTFHNRFTLLFSRVLGTESVALESIAMFPNPTMGQLNIASPQAAIEKVEVYDLMGRMITMHEAGGADNVRLELSGLRSSVYFVTITTDQGVLTKKIVRK
ncbi:T9SS type A sorting domain-containing protein [Aureisphaera galaxeae]|uniref:T9SS-dependent choice-of-anchor J family protein n=1 Tax=Aureisphaera galaxeae TaxID=1538023 RepID=UPI002350B7C9|nr:T9SS type A sorting domain-containing protein [Aureisphaera galaxeae]MDC8003271.1 T9SS type A sorting domain-containing protein [Aureisphaera galaxeae]